VDSRPRRRPYIARGAACSGNERTRHRGMHSYGCIGTSYSRARARRRSSVDYSCPLGKSDTKSIHVYLRVDAVARCLTEHVARTRGGQHPPDLFRAVRLAVSLSEEILIRPRYDSTLRSQTCRSCSRLRASSFSTRSVQR